MGLSTLSAIVNSSHISRVPDVRRRHDLKDHDTADVVCAIYGNILA